ncbi:hypothetical protein ACH495_04985 [Micromonospora sp. NPDC018662]
MPGTRSSGLLALGEIALAAVPAVIGLTARLLILTGRCALAATGELHL